MRKINRCTNRVLQDICEQAIRLEDLKLKVNEFLPEFLQAYCSVASFVKGCLTIITTDPVWATQLRYSIPELRDKLRKEAGIFNLTSIKVSSLLPSEPLRKKAIQTPTISSKARNLILDQAMHCNYQPLKEALQHLAEKPLKCQIPAPEYGKK